MSNVKTITTIQNEQFRSPQDISDPGARGRQDFQLRNRIRTQPPEVRRTTVDEPADEYPLGFGWDLNEILQ